MPNIIKTLELVRGSDIIECQILDNGQIKILTPGSVTPENHANAENLLEALANLGFSLENVSGRGQKTHHHHHHAHTHSKY